MNDREISKEIKISHDRVADFYGISKPDPDPTEFSYNLWNTDRNIRAHLRQILRQYYHGGFVLDAGCGNGQISKIYLELGIDKIIGVDFSDRMLRASRRRMHLNHLDSRFIPICADLHHLQFFRRGSFHFIHMFGVIEHLDKPANVLRNFAELLAPSGILVLGVPRKWSLSFFSYLATGQSPNRWGLPKTIRENFNFKEKLNYYRFFTPDCLLKILDATRTLQVLERRPFARFHIDGFPGAFLHWLGSKGERGYRALDSLECIASRCHLIPAGEYWIMQNTSGSE
jgi:2-polyprenyl-3-methyl-5-hydroxy-6-metoxy-1,4-benzoquinol methylase